MDILYIIGEGCSLCNNKELRYSLRSIERHGKGISRVFVAGYCPPWLSDKVVKVPFIQPYPREGVQVSPDRMSLKHANILATLLQVVDNTDIGEEFLVSMDDHIYVRDVDFDKYPFYVKKFRENNLLPESGHTSYRRFLAATRKRCEADLITAYYLCPHRNMHCSRKTISDCRTLLEEIVATPLPVESFAYLLNYRYTKDADFTMEVAKDVKVYNGADWWMTDSKTTEVFSTGDFLSGSGLDILIEGLFRDKCKYEL